LNTGRWREERERERVSFELDPNWEKITFKFKKFMYV
jgi:hypothetical protein